VDSAPKREPLNPTQLMLLVWLIGMTLVAATIVVGFAKVTSLSRNARRIRKDVLAARVRTVAREMGARNVIALEGAERAMPMTWGILRPRLLLPSTARSWPRAKLDLVLRHELAHVRRHDSMWQLIAEIVCALYWFNPLVWYAAQRMRIEREHACDDEVLAAGSRASDYAAELLEIARSLRSARATSLAAIAMAQPRQLEGRLLAVLDETRRRGAIVRQWPFWVVAALIVVPIAALSPQLREVQAKQVVKAALKSVNPLTSQASQMFSALPQAKKAIQVQSVGDCFSEDLRNVSINSHSDDDYQRIKWDTKRCKGTVLIRGRVKLAGDLSGIESMDAGAEFTMTEDDGTDEHELTVKNVGGQPSYDYSLNGKRTAFDAKARAWFTQGITNLVRGTGFAADERVDYLLKSGGVNAVLKEVEAMRSDYVQRQYLRRVIAKTTLSGEVLENVINTATRSLSSDYEMAEFLTDVAKKYDFNETARKSFIAATNTLQSDYEHRRALSAVLSKGGLATEDVVAVLNSLVSMDSDYEKAELLIGIATRYKLDPRMRQPYLAAASKIDSDYEKGRVLKTLLKNNTLGGAELSEVLESLVTMDSDYEKSQVLQMIAGSDMSDANLQQTYLKLASNIRSDYELRQSLMALLGKQKVNTAAVDVVLRAAGQLDSDYELAELLVHVLKHYQLTAAQREQAIKATESISSDYERGRVASLLLRRSSTN
jgi:beta-lactamase regulating signal transducer with metallopeptidase domain